MSDPDSNYTFATPTGGTWVLVPSCAAIIALGFPVMCVAAYVAGELHLMYGAILVFYGGMAVNIGLVFGIGRLIKLRKKRHG